MRKIHHHYSVYGGKLTKSIKVIYQEKLCRKTSAKVSLQMDILWQKAKILSNEAHNHS